MKWRVCRSVPLNVYEGDRPICQCHNEQDAQRIVEAFAAVERLEAERQAAVESAAVTARRIVTAWIDPKSYKLQPDHEQELQAAIAAALAERHSDTARLDWCIAHGALPLKGNDGQWSVFEEGYMLTMAGCGTPREAIDAAIESTKEPANG